MISNDQTEQTTSEISFADLNRAVTAMDGAALRFLLEAMASRDVEITKEPETGLVMMNVTDCFNTDFHLGEVLVTTAEVRLGNQRGWGMIMGDDGERALLLAGIDVILRDAANLFGKEIRAELAKWLAKAETKLLGERRRAAATRVNFQTMATE